MGTVSGGAWSRSVEELADISDLPKVLDLSFLINFSSTLHEEMKDLWNS